MRHERTITEEVWSFKIFGWWFSATRKILSPPSGSSDDTYNRTEEALRQYAIPQDCPGIYWYNPSTQKYEAG